MEPSPLRDNGPYTSHEQTRSQFAAVAYGIPTRTSDDLTGISALVLAEALLIAGVDTSDYEQAALAAIARQLDPEMVQVIAGWVIRARLAGAHPAPKTADPCSADATEP
ncbi:MULTISPECIES: hypothetical protein [Micromonospora]|uniref:hypothetical protein n=1 Tax=Micromonospora TaxID=1873 RepID=UPI00064BE009|nr:MULTISPECIES: hypothetical protein [unclassified Micromonospora]MDG4756202.1 hypothetical protein [Micromonospora sp. WMMD718]